MRKLTASEVRALVNEVAGHHRRPRYLSILDTVEDIVKDSVLKYSYSGWDVDVGGMFLRFTRAVADDAVDLLGKNGIKSSAADDNYAVWVPTRNKKKV